VVPTDANEEAVTNEAKMDEKVAAHLQDKTIRKTIYVPNKLINFVVS
jgi:leucyl-tRNA synthetase